MNLDFSKRRVLVTGSSSGVGFDIARAFLSNGAHVVVNGRNQERLDRAEKELSGNVFSVCADVSRHEGAQFAVATAVHLLGGLDIVICNVGFSRSSKPGDEKMNDWLTMFQLNVMSTANIIELAAPFLKKSKGNVVCVSSICGCEIIPGAPVTYACAKSALNTMVKGLSRPLGSSHVRINAVAPGNILFSGSVWEKKLAEGRDGVERMLAQSVPLQRFGTPADISNAILFLASDFASFITGEVLIVDGGQTVS